MCDRRSQGVPIKAVCVQAIFDGEVDASTVKHRLDVLNELRLPVYITDFAIANLDPAKHAYELEKFLRIAFSHPAVAGITLGDLWDKANPWPSSGLYTTSKQPKPAATKLEQLWTSEWSTSICVICRTFSRVARLPSCFSPSDMQHERQSNSITAIGCTKSSIVTANIWKSSFAVAPSSCLSRASKPAPITRSSAVVVLLCPPESSCSRNSGKTASSHL